MRERSRPITTLVASVALLSLLAACQSAAEQEPEEVLEEEVLEDEPEEVLPEVFALPDTCRDILPLERFEQLIAGDLDLLRGPGSGSTETVYPEGPSPQEERGGISCLFANADETESYTISIAPMTQASRAEVIDGLLDQQLNPGQTADGVLTYWIQGDQATVPAIYNALYDDAWYEVLIFPGGRIAYEQSETLVSHMRDHTTVVAG